MIRIGDKKHVKRILKALWDGALAFLLLPGITVTLAFVLWGGLGHISEQFEEALASIFSIHGGYAWLVAGDAAPFGFPLVAYLSYRFPDFRWRRDWWFILIAEYAIGLVGAAWFWFFGLPEITLSEYIPGILCVPAAWYLYARIHTAGRSQDRLGNRTSP